MYKIIHNNIIIDVVKNLRYVRYIPELKRLIPCGATTAQGICGSLSGTYYALQGVNLPVEKNHWKKVSYFKIDEKEYNDLKSRLGKDYILYANNVLLDVARKEKISKLSIECNDLITKGVSVLLNDGIYYNFRLTLEDQINILELEKEVKEGASEVFYHSTNNVCRTFTAEELLRLSNKASKFKKYHTTYFNLLKYCINNIYNIKEINNIEYGVDLLTLDISDGIKEEVKEKLSWLKL